MKDLVIKARTVRRELYVLLGCFIVAVGVNLYAIFTYSRPISELWTMVGFEVVLALVIYAALILVRLVIALVLRLVRRVRA